MQDRFVGLRHTREAWRGAVVPTGETFAEDDSPEGIERLARRIGELRPAAVLVQALGGGDIPVVVALLERGVRVRVTSKEQVRTFAATAGAGLLDVSTVARVAGSARFVSERMGFQKDDERVRLLLARRRQVLEMQAQEEERLRGAEDGPFQEELKRHLFFLDRQLGGARAAVSSAGGLALPFVGGARQADTSRQAACCESWPSTRTKALLQTACLG
ncbi:hypothetical protein [Deinococcus planocerae]|uniref:hypothetical protein n=1 Tax=Deinococcus planocerae TaxID=1737569 RepID=UPI0011AFC3ED|nr:hypothetical protein [Deinococcus planocerae]